MEPGEHLLFELQARELGTSKLEGIISVYDPAGKKLDSAGDKPLPEDVFAVQGTSRTSTDPFLNFTVPEGVREITVTVEDLALRGGPAYGYRLSTRKQAMDFKLSLASPFVNVPAGGTVAISVVSRPPRLRRSDSALHSRPAERTASAWRHDPREYVDANNARTMNRRGMLAISADPGVELPQREFEVWGEGVLRRRQRAAAAGARTRHGGGCGRRYGPGRGGPAAAGHRAVARPGPACRVRAASGRDTRSAADEPRQIWRKARATSSRTRGNCADASTPPAQVSVDVIGARDIRVIDMKAGKEEGRRHFRRDHHQGHRPRRLRSDGQRNGEDRRRRRTRGRRADSISSNGRGWQCDGCLKSVVPRR